MTTVRLAAMAVFALAVGASASAQTPAQPTPQEIQGRVGSKGVRVLKAEEPVGAGGASSTATQPPSATVVAPAPAPAPTPVRVVTPTPAPAPVTPPAIQLCARPFKTSDVRWDGVSKLDAVLAPKLKTRQRVVVDLAQPYAEAGAPPEGLSRWFAEVRNGGGQVTVQQYCKAARGNLGTWLAKLGESLSGGRAYRPARQYDVLLHADALDRVVTQVEFVPKSVAS